MTVSQSPLDSPAGLYTLISVHSSPAVHWQAMGSDTRITVNYNNEDNELQCTADILRDLLDIRDGMKECDLLSKDEIGQIIDFYVYSDLFMYFYCICVFFPSM